MPAKSVLDVLEMLALAYPDRSPDRQTLQLYLEHLADIPLQLLERAARQHIDSSPWFPRIADLRQLAARLANTSRFDTLPPPATYDVLAAQAEALEQAFYLRGELDEAAWLSVIERFERANRPHRAEWARQRLAIYKAWDEEE
jgi:hypothetical protein